ncbi:MAG: hypothetical protein ATN31_00265 [Candidatus Epulonipiscioides saccharophilum]|nr:MAG: hypothetical protein ATN31_00265 [Epulopiscium sp. AS2M-Bin001]
MQKRKNILFILTDQQRADFCGCYGATWLKTPNIDMLASEGVLYKHAVTPSAACVPARASLLTGRSPIENRVINNAQWLRPDHTDMNIFTWPQILAKEGYHTASIGKMHFYPWDISEGFQYRIIAEDKRHNGIQDDYSMFLKKHGYERVHGSISEGYYENLGATVSHLPEELQIDRYVCDRTLEYLDLLNNQNNLNAKNQKEEVPFAMMIGFPGPHCPYDPSQEMLDKMQDSDDIPNPAPRTKTSDTLRDRNIRDNSLSWNGVDITEFSIEKAHKVRLHYSALVQAIDEYLGQIIAKLKEHNMYDDTIIIFSSDHGDYLGDFGMAGKAHFYEGAIRIPMIIRNPGTQPLEINHPVSLTDIFNTILNFAGLNPVDTFDSTTLAPFGSSEKREDIFGCIDLGWMLLSGQFKYCVYYNGTQELFDISSDKLEQNNLLEDENYSLLAKQMRTELDKRVFAAILAGTADNVAQEKLENRSRSASNPFSHHGWERTYPNKVDF